MYFSGSCFSLDSTSHSWGVPTILPFSVSGKTWKSAVFQMLIFPNVYVLMFGSSFFAEDIMPKV